VSDSDTLARLRALSDETFGRFVADVAETVASDATVTVAPPSPAGGVDAVVESGGVDRRLLFHVRRPAGPGPTAAGVTDETDAPGRLTDEGDEADPADPTRAVPAFGAADLRAVLTVGESFDTVVVAVVGPVTAEARAVAEDAGVRLLAGDDLLALVQREGVEVPRPESVAERFDRLVERQASEWPQTIRDLTARTLAEIETVADFDHRIVHADETTDVDFLLGVRGGSERAESESDAERGRRTEPVVRARLTDREFLVYVADTDGQFDCVVTLSAVTEREPSPESVLDEVIQTVNSAVERIR
jgi:hypothetical protein